MKKPTVIVLFALVLIVAAVGAALWLQQKDKPSQEGEIVNQHTTNSVIYFDDENPPADPLMVGRWTCVGKEDWHKVYYDDYDGEGRFWGKEWDESDDVQEEDLTYHGNGWFRWEKRQDTLMEYYTMDSRDVPIAHSYKINMHDSTDIEQVEMFYRSAYHFIKH